MKDHRLGPTTTAVQRSALTPAGSVGKRTLVQQVQRKAVQKDAAEGGEAAPAAAPAEAAAPEAAAPAAAEGAAPADAGAAGAEQPAAADAGGGEEKQEASGGEEEKKAEEEAGEEEKQEASGGEEAAPAGAPAAEETPVQGKAKGSAQDPEHVQTAAAEGVSGSGGGLPHGDAIQRSFGKHDVSGIKAHTDDKAAAATGAMGAEAYATGDQVAFAGGSPSLHTAAHEAAHTIQQKAGVQLAGGVGAVGDSYEAHADAVADAVVAGESAEGLLDAGPGGGGGGSGGGGGVQRLAVQMGPPKPPAAPAPKPAAPPPPAPKPAAPKTPAPAGPKAAAPATPAAPTPNAAAPAAPAAPAKVDPAPLLAVTDAVTTVEGPQLPLGITPGGEITAASAPIETQTDTAKPKESRDRLKQFVSDFLNPATTEADRQKLLVKIRVEMKVLRTEMAKARGEEEPIVQQRVKFEKNIGAKAFAEEGAFKGANAAVSAMAASALRMIAGSKPGTVDAGAKIDDVLKALAKDPALSEAIVKIGIPTTIGFAGAVGRSFDAVTNALMNGSLTEKAVHLINFGDEFLKKHLMDKTATVLAQVHANLATLGSPTDIDAKIQAAHDAKLNPLADKKAQEKREKDGSKGLFSGDVAREDGSSQSFQSIVNDNGDMDSKTPEVPLEALDRQALINLARQKNVDYSEGISTEALLAKIKAASLEPDRVAKAKDTPDKKATPEDKSQAIGLTSNADMTVPGAPGLTKEAMPYLEGIRANMVHPDHVWIANAVAAQMPLKAGISGTTHRFLGLGELLGVGDRKGMRLAMLGHLQAIEAHSFFEICDAVGMGPPAGKYVPFDPVPPDAMEAAAKETLLTDPAFAKVGEKDRAAQAKRLLGLIGSAK